LLLLAGFYAVIDVIGFRAWSFVFIVIGANAILATWPTNSSTSAASGESLRGLTKHFGTGADFGWRC